MLDRGRRRDIRQRSIPAAALHALGPRALEIRRAVDAKPAQRPVRDRMTNGPDWSLCVFTARESLATLCDCLRAACAAIADHDAAIDVLVNGNEALALGAATFASTLGERDRVRVWRIELQDKAHAWNEYVHRIWRPGRIVF